MLQTNPISGPAVPPQAADPTPEGPLRSPRATLVRAEDGIAPAGGPPAASGRTPVAARKKSGSATKKTTTAGYAKATAKDDFAFLRDPKLTLEQKIMRFMIAMAKKLDEDIRRRMEELAPKDAKNASSSSSSKKSSKKGPFAALGKTIASLVKKPLGDLLKQVAGPVLAAGASALGFPALAPLLLKAGPAIGQLAGELLGSLADASTSGSGGASGEGGGTSSSSTSKSSSSGMDSSEERVKMMELQNVLEKQKEMVSLVSNMLRTFHEMRMSAINNIR